MNVLGIIPARGGSKGVPQKNIKLLNSKPLIFYTIQAAKASNLSDLIISTDCPKIAEIAKSFSVKVPFLRPNELSTDHAKSIDVAIHALKKMEEFGSKKYDAVMLLQPTTPYRSANHINKALDIIKNQPDLDSVISVVDVEGHHPARMKYIQNNILIDPPFCEEFENQNRQELEKMYIRNGAIYLTRKDVLLNKSFKGKKSHALLMSAESSINIDSKLDFKFAEFLLKENLINKI